MRDAALLGALVLAGACERAPEPVAASPQPTMPAPAPVAASTPAARPSVVAMQQAPRAGGAPAPTLAVYTLSRGKGVPDETRATLKKIREYLDVARKDDRVTAIESSRIGIEGETRLCIEFRDAASAAELGKQVRAMAGDVELLNVVEENCPTGESQK